MTLDGSGSSDPDGDLLTYAWTQTAGPVVTLSDPSGVQPSFTAPTVTIDTVFTFELVVGDGEFASAPDAVSITVASGDESDLTQLGAIIARVTAPTGAGNPGIEVIRDGDMPPDGDFPLRQYDTFDGFDPVAEDWIGYSFGSSHLFTRVVFQEGNNFFDGGWFESLTVQIRQGGVWAEVTGLSITPAYPAADNDIDFDFDFDFDFDLHADLRSDQRRRDPHHRRPRRSGLLHLGRRTLGFRVLRRGLWWPPPASGGRRAADVSTSGLRSPAAPPP